MAARPRSKPEKDYTRDPSRAARRACSATSACRDEGGDHDGVHRRARHQVLGPSGLVDARSRESGSSPRSWWRRRGSSRACVAGIDPNWLEEIGAHLLKREPPATRTGRRSRGQVIALERGTLYGLPVYFDRRVPFAPLDPKLARDIFIRSALVRGRARDARAVLRPQPAPGRRHRAPRAQVAPAGHPGRRRADPRVLRRARARATSIAPRTSSAGARRPKRARPKLLHLSREDLMRHEAAGITTQNFPPALELGPNRFALEYHFEPGSARDGVTLTVPLALLNQVPAARTEWLVPGPAQGKGPGAGEVDAAAPAPQARRAGRVRRARSAAASAAVRSAAGRGDGAATSATRSNLEVPVDAFRPDSAPPHLHMNFRVLDEHGRQLGMGRDLAGAEARAGRRDRDDPAGRIAASGGERYTGWTMGDLPELMEIERGGQTLVGLSGAGRRRRRGHAAGVRLAGEGARGAPRRRAAAARHRVPRPHPRPRAHAGQGRRRSAR